MGRRGDGRGKNGEEEIVVEKIAEEGIVRRGRWGWERKKWGRGDEGGGKW